MDVYLQSLLVQMKQRCSHIRLSFFDCLLQPPTRLLMTRYNGKILVDRFKGFSLKQLDEIRAAQLRQLEERAARAAAEAAEQQVRAVSLAVFVLYTHTLFFSRAWFIFVSVHVYFC